MLATQVNVQARALESRAIGEGTDVRFVASRISGAMLVREGCVIHPEAHRSQD